MRYVIFDYIEDEKGSAIYPDDRKLFRDTDVIMIDGVRRVIGRYNGAKELTEAQAPILQKLGPKTIYSKPAFVALIPKTAIRGMQTAALTNDDVNMLLFNLPMMDRIDLNTLPPWFVEGFSALVVEGVFTQEQIVNLLELGTGVTRV